MPSARPRATATMSTSSTSEPEPDDEEEDEGPFFVATSLYSLAGLLVTGSRRGVGDRGLGERLLVDGLTGHFGIGRSRCLRRRVVQQTALDDLLRTRVAALADAG